MKKLLNIQWKRLENPGGGARGREAPLPLLLLPLEARETEEGTGGMGGAHQDVGEDPHDMEEGGHCQQEEEVPTDTLEEGPTETLIPVQG